MHSWGVATCRRFQEYCSSHLFLGQIYQRAAHHTILNACELGIYDIIPLRAKGKYMGGIY